LRSLRSNNKEKEKKEEEGENDGEGETGMGLGRLDRLRLNPPLYLVSMVLSSQ
jgi:hypothetical protein